MRATAIQANKILAQGSGVFGACAGGGSGSLAQANVRLQQSWVALENDSAASGNLATTASDVDSTTNSSTANFDNSNATTSMASSVPNSRAFAMKNQHMHDTGYIRQDTKQMNGTEWIIVSSTQALCRLGLCRAYLASDAGADLDPTFKTEGGGEWTFY